MTQHAQKKDPSRAASSEPLLAAARSSYATGRIEKAIELLEQICSAQPDNIDARTLLFASYKDGGHTVPMLGMARQFSDSPANENELALAWSAWLSVGDFAAAGAIQDKVIKAACGGRISTDLLPAILLASNGLADIDAQTLSKLHNAWAAHLPANPGHPAREAGSHGRIRLAYVSGDFFRHPVSYFLLPVLSSHDHTRFEIFCYCNTRQPADDLSEAIRQQCDHFIDITRLSDAELCQRMRDDGIDIAIDLAGHTANGRATAFALRCAPVQVSWLGYPNTTGLSAMDFRIVDAHTDPEHIREGQVGHYTEALLRMPDSFLCYGIQWDVEPAKSAPCEQSGKITFASFNNGRKINPAVLAAWSNILEQVPNSRLLLKFAGCTQPELIQNLHAFFTARGIDAGRVEFLPRTETVGEHIALYRDVDIALDTFPYTGTTTTFEALSQGVPVITLTGPEHRNRVSYSILKNIGYEETITDNVDAYVRRAVKLAGNPQALGILRDVLPLLVRHAGNNQPEPFTRNLETVLLQACEARGLAIVEAAQSPQPACEPETRRLHIGGHEAHPEWEILDANPSEITDHVGNASDLSRFADNAFDAVYSSHVLEHFSYQGELHQVLREWYRVLKPGGILYASVPNLEVLCELFLKRDTLSPDERFLVMRMMFGGQIDPYDFHKVGYNEEILGAYLAESGFTDIQAVESFDLFNDTSNMEFAGRRISLNLLARKEAQANTETTVTDTEDRQPAAASPAAQETRMELADSGDPIVNLAAWAMQSANIKPLRIVEIGARIIDEGNSQEAPERFHKLQQAQVIAFEPDADSCAQLNSIKDGLAASLHAYPYALGREKGRQTLYVTREGMCSSLYKPNDALIDRFEGMEVSRLKEEVEIDVISLDEFMRMEKLRDIDFIKIDVQGAELDVFRGAEHTLKDVIGICTEVEWAELYEGQPMFSDLDGYLKAQGFQLHHLLGAGTRPIRGRALPGQQQYLWSDAVYFPSFERIPRLSKGKLIKLAAMAMLYDALTLAMDALKAYDEKSGTRLAEQFHGCFGQQS